MIMKDKVFLIGVVIKKEIHFAVEGLSLYDNETYNHIEIFGKLKKLT